jgi:hypothetical protein
MFQLRILNGEMKCGLLLLAKNRLCAASQYRLPIFYAYEDYLVVGEITQLDFFQTIQPCDSASQQLVGLATRNRLYV